MSASSSPAPAVAPKSTGRPIKRVAILFAGGPAPAANAVISTCAASFLNHGIEVVGVMNGYSHLVEFAPDHPMQEGRDYVLLTAKRLRRTRNTRGIMIGTARTNPGKDVSHPSHLKDAKRTTLLRTVHEALTSLGVDALVSIGGDDTLKTANKFKLFQDALPADQKRISVVHVPKTIDNDYRGIDFTFGYFTAVETLAEEIRNLLADGEATRGYFIAECMGRSAGWLAYGAAIASEASLVMSVEDMVGDLMTEETVTDPKTGVSTKRKIMNIDAFVDKIVSLMVAREKLGKEHGVVVLAEGLASFLPSNHLEGAKFDEHGHLSLAATNMARLVNRLVEKAYEQRTGKKRRITPVQLGYESRCALPHAFDVMLGSQLGVGAVRALVEKQYDGVMISTAGQLELSFVPFETLIDPETLVTVVRFIAEGSDFQKLARLLEASQNY
ncbi:6-phosphofructokinase [Planctomyces sp. SH-PL62]|uniref:6-phosphofructokinase n=1 Tax=Planctomyces sp. SH-PL62 TaxID=1636152 RepID=UPI00078B8B4F|nr:6-phosphofructokinase [Planctomyces sp. SH-PL62]AMV38980.1 6-phosphofructokinase 1 [Planctomyces sp. SH-PL62]